MRSQRGIQVCHCFLHHCQSKLRYHIQAPLVSISPTQSLLESLKSYTHARQMEFRINETIAVV